MVNELELGQKYRVLAGVLDERSRRLWAAAEARAARRGGFAAVLRATGLSSKTLARGLRELNSGESPPLGRVRRPGAGRKAATTLIPELATALEVLVEPATNGHRDTPLRWTSKSTRRLAQELRARGYHVSHHLVAQLLREAGYRLQADRKMRNGTHDPECEAQFRHIEERVRRQVGRHEPAISVEIKKRAGLGIPNNGAVDSRQVARPRGHDLGDRQHGKAVSNGMYGLGLGAGWVSVGVGDMSSFAANAVRRWWRQMGRRAYPSAHSLLIIPDNGKDHTALARLSRWELQKLADETGLTIQVCHVPPGTIKWNNIEHRHLSLLEKSWRGRRRLMSAAIINVVGKTKTPAGLTVRCAVDRRRYARHVRVADGQLGKTNLTPDPLHGEWNYAIRPNGHQNL